MLYISSTVLDAKVSTKSSVLVRDNRQAHCELIFTSDKRKYTKRNEYTSYRHIQDLFFLPLNALYNSFIVFDAKFSTESSVLVRDNREAHCELIFASDKRKYTKRNECMPHQHVQHLVLYLLIRSTIHS